MSRARHALAALILAATLAAPGARAAPDHGRIAEARALLAEAAAALEAAETGEASLAALGQAVSAHEAALANLRAGLRAMAAEDRRLADRLGAEHGRLATLLGALQALARAPRAAILAHPDGALRAARAAGLMAEIAPALERRMGGLEARLDALRALRTSQEVARLEARAALAGLQALRGETIRALSRRDPPPDRARLAAEAARAAAGARDLDAFAATLEAVLPGQPGEASFADQRGRLSLPAAGRITGLYGGTDPWGRTGEGITITAPAYAQVSAPWDATVRFAGPLLDYGKVVVLEPEQGWLIVLAGLGTVARSAGESVLKGERLGDLGGPLPSSEEFLLEAAGQGAQIKREALYVELRRRGEAIDPLPWFGHDQR